jgi:hypothetical protein
MSGEMVRMGSENKENKQNVEEQYKIHVLAAFWLIELLVAACNGMKEKFVKV